MTPTLTRLWLRTGRLLAWLPQPASDFGESLAAMRPTHADTRAELHTALRKRAQLEGQLAHWIDQAIRARGERDRADGSSEYAHTCLASAMDRNVDLTTRILVLEADAETFARQREDLTVIAEGLRDELRDLRAAVSTGAARKKGKR